jgi:hypothetical protein
MTRINRDQFLNDFSNLEIDINKLSPEMESALKDAKISKDQLAAIAQGDGKIQGEELKGLFDAVDTFDNGVPDGWLETAVKDPHRGNVQTTGGEFYDAMKLQLQRSVTSANIGGPNTTSTKSAQPPKGERYLDSQFDSQHVKNATEYLSQEGYREEFLLELSNSRKGQTVSTSNSKDTNGAYKELGAGFTTKEYNAVLSNVLSKEGGEFKNPEAAKKLAYGTWGMESFKRFEKEATKENKIGFIHAALTEPKFSTETKTEILKKLTTEKAGSNSPTLEELIRSAPKESMNEITRLMSETTGFTDPKPGPLAKQASKLPDQSQMKLVRATIDNPDLSSDQKRQALQNLMLSQDAQSLNHLVSKSSLSEKKELASVIAGNKTLLERVGRNMTPGNQKAIADQILNLGAPKNVTGEALSIMMHPANMKPSDRNGMIDHFQKTGQLRDFVETQVGAPIAKTLLPCLNPQNTAAIQNEFRKLAKSAGEDPSVSNPKNLGRTDETGQEAGYETGTTQENSKTNEHTDSSSHTVGGEVGGGLKVGIPFLVDGKIEGKGSYSYETGHSDSHSETQGTAWEYAQTYSTNNNTSIDRGEPERYDRDIRNYQNAEAFNKQVDVIDQWAAQEGEAYAQSYRKEAQEINPGN